MQNPQQRTLTLAEIATSEFQAGVTAVLRSWSALRTAVENEWGGPKSKSKAEELRSNILEFFEYSDSVPVNKPKLHLENLEDNLFLYMEEEFTIVLEDDSEKQVAYTIWQMYEMCGKGDFTLARQMVNSAEKFAATYKPQKVAVQTEGLIDEDSDEEMETDDMGQEGSNATTSIMTESSLPSIVEVSTAQEYAASYLFGAPPGSVKNNQRSAPRKDKPEPEVDEDGFTTVPIKRRGNR